ncbi:methyltransferase [Microbulbifer sp.]|uniref:methyltransferase n=1 Tax=Microbulbifer sp. TaxID=1908541 RepID=UPI00258C3B8E|nr:methyltransferase [Microbulbifer sp.]
MSTLLAQLIGDSDSDTLWIADENSKPLLQTGVTFPGLLLTNRWDIAHHATSLGVRAVFNDFDLAEPGIIYSRIVYPVSKEKAAVHHVINQAPSVLVSGGSLCLLGEKSSGIKTYAQKAAQRFATTKRFRKHGSEYLCTTALGTSHPDTPTLDDSDYQNLQQPAALHGLFSKPGLFGWNKVDTGSALLASLLAEEALEPGMRAVDLGSGYGYLSAQLAKAGGFQITATDNNAAALRACRKNFQDHNIAPPEQVIAGDAGSELNSGSADLIICNPPFHQGFQVEGDLTDRFLQQAARILAANGKALFVVNEFIPLGKKAQPYFKRATVLLREKGFCVYRLEK